MNSAEVSFGKYIITGLGILSDASAPPVLVFGTAGITERRKRRSVLSRSSVTLISPFIEVHHLLKYFRGTEKFSTCSVILLSIHTNAFLIA